ncbi:MAG: Asp/Glu racemase [Pseudomonadota bacterium]
MNVSLRPSRGLARIGVIVPVSNTNLEPDMTLLAPAGVSIHVARAGGYDVDEIPDGAQMRQYSDVPIDDVTERLRHCRPDVVLYGCTSATLAQGADFDAEFRRTISAQTGAPAITAASALVEALRGLGVQRFALSSPYVATLNDLAIGYIEGFGFRCVGRADVPEPLGNDAVGALRPDTVAALARRADCADAECIVLSCTDFRAVEAVEEIEAHLGKPVITSNQAMMLAALRQLDLLLGDSPLRRHRLTRHLMAA